jgi:nucleotide-binding universal stress UspA family protein
MKILLTTDGSMHSLATLQAFIDRKSMFAGPLQIALINVHLAVPYSRAVAWVGKENVERYYAEECDVALTPGAALLEQHEIPYEKVKRVGDPAHEVVKFAEEWGADLIVTGTKGHSAVASLVIGSVAQKIIAQTTRPIMLLR